jgi:Tol biopolymer transport system component
VELISVGSSGKADGYSSHPDVSDDGDRVSFTSDAPNLVDDDTNGNSDLFVRERSSSTTIRAKAGVREARISGNGQVVVFTTEANLLVPEDENYNSDVFAHEIDSGVTERVSLRSDGGDAYGAEEVECGREPRCAGTSDISTHSPSISADGDLIYFISAASEISDEDDDGDHGQSGEEVYIRNRREGATYLVSRYRDGSALHSTNWYPGEISPDGRWVTYSNNSMKLDGPRGDQDPGPDVFLQRLPL